MNKFNCLLSLLFLASCMNSTKETKPKNIVIESNNIESQEKKCNFSDFVKMFTMDSVFQKEHVKFPLEIVLYGTDPDDSDSVSYVKESDWYFVTLNDSVIDGIKFMHQIDTANTTVTKVGYDTGIKIEYRFNKLGLQWQLVKIEDHSN